MKRSPKTPRPTQAELEILAVLWQRGPSSVREVLQQLAESRATGYTTVLKLLQIMVGKGLVFATRLSAVMCIARRSSASRRSVSS
jgi:predicted transcriptional regulator